MQYTIKSANGHAGEFFFAYKIAKVLKWPCRLIDIDIGIDAQVEIITINSRQSTGRFVAFQIKSSSDSNTDDIYVNPAQLSYWKELSLPVFVVLVDLSKSAMYLHQVDLKKKYPTTKLGSVIINFNKTRDKFCKKSASLIAHAADDAVRDKARRYIDVVAADAEIIRRAIYEQDESPDSDLLVELVRERSIFKSHLAQAQGAVDSLNVCRDEYEEVAISLDEAISELRQFLVRYSVNEWADSDIIEFMTDGD